MWLGILQLPKRAGTRKMTWSNQGFQVKLPHHEANTWEGRGDLKVIGNIRVVCGWLPFLSFSDYVGTLLYNHLDLTVPLCSAEEKKNSLFLSHLVPEIIGLIFTQICHLNVLKNFVQIFSLNLHPVDPLFIDFNSFFHLILQILRSDWVHIFIVCWTPTKNMVRSPLCANTPHRKNYKWQS